MTTPPEVTPAERMYLRELATRVAEIAALPEMAERIRLWTEHNSLRPARPLVLIKPEGAWRELLPDRRCASDVARALEFDLRSRIYTFEHFRSDDVVTDEMLVQPAVRSTGYGLEPHRHASPEALGAWKFDPVVKERGDLEKLHLPEFTLDEDAAATRYAFLHDLFGDILTVKRTGVKRICFHLMKEWTDLRGLEETMMDMYEEPEFLHDAMAFLTEGHLRRMQWHVDHNLLALNNDSQYQGSGGNGWTDDLPAPGFDPARVRLCDMWGTAEAQELALVSPAQHVEFCLQYEARLLAPFGLNNYGCCEDLTRKMADVLALPNIRRISVSPFADVDACAAQIEDRAIVSWKPHPGHLVGNFDADHVRGHVRHALEVAGHGHLEMVLKDTHTCESHPERFDQWSRIAMEEIERFAGAPGLPA
jgi:hypothetical protein